MRDATPGAWTSRTMGEAGWLPGKNDAITDVAGIRVGHWTDRRAATGCTVVLCEEAQFVAVDARGGAPGTRETDVLAGANLVRKAHAIVLSGGSAFGLAASDGVMTWLRERGVGFETAAGKVPIVSGAVVYDLGLGRGDRVHPGEREGYQAAARARRGRVAEGSVGAGTGATVAKLLGPELRLKGGVGTASLVGPRDIVVGALAVTNALGSVFDPETGDLLAGARGDAPGEMLGLPEVLVRREPPTAEISENTTLVVVATNANLTHERLVRLAYQAHDGMARAIQPVHTLADGDVAFAIGMGATREPHPDDALVAGVLAVHAVERAIVKSVRQARGLAGVPSAEEWRVAR